MFSNIELSGQKIKKLKIYVCPFWESRTSITYDNIIEKSQMVIIIGENYPSCNDLDINDLFNYLITNKDTIKDARFKYNIRLKLCFYLKNGKKDIFYVGRFKQYTHNKNNPVYVLNEQSFKEIMCFLPNRFRDW